MSLTVNIIMWTAETCDISQMAVVELCVGDAFADLETTENAGKAVDEFRRIN